MEKISCLITHSIGELDVILPILLRINANEKYKIIIFFTVKLIYKQFLKNEFYKFILKNNKFEYYFVQSPNKFDFSIINKSFIFKLLFRLKKIDYFLKIIPQLFNSNIFFHESSNQVNSTFVIYFLTIFQRKKIYVYHHAHGGVKKNIIVNKINQYNLATYLAFSNDEKNFVKQRGFKNYIIIGYPKFDPLWSLQIKQHLNNVRKTNEEHILILSRNPKAFEYEDNYINLLTQTYQTLRSYYPKKKIILKTHPRDDLILTKIYLILSPG